MELSEDRKAVLKKISEYEKLGGEYFNKDVENDPPGKTLLPNEINYIPRNPFSKLITWFSNRMAIHFFENEIKQNHLIIKNIIGLENFESVKEGAVLTCNHFSVYDNYIVYRAIKKSLKHKNLYKVIREGNYTNFPGLFGFLFRHSNTLPLSSNIDTMKKFMKAFDTLLKKGEKILVYPEQAMWWNYKKPRPFKPGAFKLAALSNAPIIPCFITMKDSEFQAPDGSYYQEFTLHIMPAIFPDKNKSVKENTKFLMDKNFEVCRQKYEEAYNMKLEY